MESQEENRHNIPTSWSTIKLKDLCQVVRGGSPRPMGDPRYFSGKIPFIKIADVTKSEGKTVSESVTHVNEEGAKKSRFLPKGSLVLSNSGTVCIPKFLAVDACIHDGFVSFLDLPREIGLDFLYYYFHFLRPYVIEKHRQGVTQVNLNTEIVGDFDLRIPPATEQQRIVDKIEELFSDLDSGIDSLKKAKQQLKVYRQAVLKWAFEGKLTAQWREEQQRQGKLESADTLLAQIKAEREQRYQKELEVWQAEVKAWEANGKEGSRPQKPKSELLSFDAIDEGLSVIPKEVWLAIRLDVIATAVDPQPSHRTPPVVEVNGIPYIGIGNIDKDTGNIDFDKARQVSSKVLEEHIVRYSLDEGDFVIGKIGTIGKPFKIPTKRFFALSANVVLVKPIQELVNASYLFYLNQSPIIDRQFREGAKATTQAAFGIKKVRLLVISYCSLLEQEKIVEEIESRLSICDQLESDIETNLKKAEALRQSILKQAFEGKLVPQDPNDEPASVLLERIRTKREAEKGNGKGRAKTRKGDN